jgi:hypothetical protein
MRASGESLAAKPMDVAKSESRSLGSLTFLLVGMVLLVTVAGLFIFLIPCWQCPLERHQALGHLASGCPLCGGWGQKNKVTLWQKWSWKPQMPEGWIEVDPNPRKLPEEKK